MARQVMDRAGADGAAAALEQRRQRPKSRGGEMGTGKKTGRRRAWGTDQVGVEGAVAVLEQRRRR